MAKQPFPTGPVVAFIALTGASLLSLETNLEALHWLALVGALVLELSAASIAGRAFLSYSVCAYAAAFVGCGWGWASVCLILGLGLRNLLRNGSMTWLVDGLMVQVPLGCAALLAHFEFHPLLVTAGLCGSYWLAGTELPSQLKSLLPELERERFHSSHEASLAARLGALVLGLALAPAAPETALLALLALTLIQGSLRGLTMKVEGLDRMVLEKRLSGLSSTLEQSESRLAETKENLTRVAGENEFIQDFTSGILRQRSQKEAIEHMLDAAQRLTGANTAAFFRARGRELVLEGHLGEKIDRDQIRLAGLEEPVARRAWEGQSIQLEEAGEDRSARIFKHDNHTIALPMGAMGILYLGSLRQMNLSAEKHILLSSLANLSGLALQLLEAH